MSSVSDQRSSISDQPRVNVADRMATIARMHPDTVAVASPGRGDVAGQNTYRTCTFAELDRDASALARGLVELGVQPGTRLALMVRPGSEFVKLVFALLRSGATAVLIDPGMGRKHLVNCLAAVEPEGFVAISAAQAVRTVLRHRFPLAKLNVTVGRRWFWGGQTYGQLLQLGQKSTVELPTTRGDDTAAIIYTSGSTGPPKGVLYTHQMFDTQVAEIGGHYDIRPGGFDLSCFPLFGLFNSAMGVTTVFPDMDFSRPASADPVKLLAAANDWRATQAFASPAVWDKLSRHCERTGEMIPTLRKVFSCGAPVPSKVLKHTLTYVSADAEMHTPYGATESLPIATIEAAEVLGETGKRTDDGAGVCVGRKFGTVEWRVIRITDEPIASIDECEELPDGEIGELIVRGPQVSPQYLEGRGRKAEGGTIEPSPSGSVHNAIAKIADNANNGSPGIWHRMGDVGYFDEQQRFWYCGRKAHRIRHRNGDLFTMRIEPVFNSLPNVKRTALVGVGPKNGQPVLVVEFDSTYGITDSADELWNQWVSIAPCIENIWYGEHSFTEFPIILFHKGLPVDVRHNAKINREQLAVWAAHELGKGKLQPGDDPRNLHSNSRPPTSDS